MSLPITEAAQGVGHAAAGFLRRDKQPDRRPAAEQHVRKVLARALQNPDLDWTEDGELVIVSGSCAVFVSVVGNEQFPAISYSAPLVENVTEAPTLYSRLNELNRSAAFGVLTFTDGVINLRYNQLADRLTDDEILLVLDIIIDQADDLDTLLADEFGGSTIGIDEEDVFDA